MLKNKTSKFNKKIQWQLVIVIKRDNHIIITLLKSLKILIIYIDIT